MNNRRELFSRSGWRRAKFSSVHLDLLWVCHCFGRLITAMGRVKVVVCQSVSRYALCVGIDFLLWEKAFHLCGWRDETDGTLLLSEKNLGLFCLFPNSPLRHVLNVWLYPPKKRAGILSLPVRNLVFVGWHNLKMFAALPKAQYFYRVVAHMCWRTGRLIACYALQHRRGQRTVLVHLEVTLYRGYLLSKTAFTRLTNMSLDSFI